MTYYRDQGWSITEGPEGFLLRRRHEAQAWMCVHGGTTVTVAVMVHGRRLVIANVGDSTALLAGVAADASVRPVAEWNDLSTASDKHSVAACGSAGATAVTQLSCDHSPENESEFKRMRAFRPCQHRRHHPELLFVYDTLSSSKLSCPPIFSLDDAGNPHATGRGAYYKNVRNEWATLVAVPPFARFQDALAFTRSVGDFHLQTYGVSYVPTPWLWLWWRLSPYFQRCACVCCCCTSHTPDVVWLDLGSSPIAKDADGSGTAATSDDAGQGAKAGTAPTPFALVMCSDGVWDNWKFEDLAQFVMDPARVAKAVSTVTGTQEATNELMLANLERGRANFGNSADNMTALIAFMQPV